MRILYLTHRLPYAANRGDRIRAYHFLQHLARRHTIDLVSLVHDEEEASHAGDLLDVAGSVTIARVRRFRQARRAAAAMLTEEPLTHALLDAAHLKERIALLFRRTPPDLVLALCSGMARYALMPPLSEVPFVLDMVDVDSEKWATLGRTTRGPRAWIYRREATLLGQFEQRASNAADATLVVNERERASLAALGVTAKIDIVPNGVELSGFQPPAGPAAEPRVVFCGVMNYEPNETAALWLAREVWPEVRRARPDARLMLLGAKPTRRLQRLSVADASVEVTGAVPDVRPYLWGSAVSVAPLLVARGVQNKVLEAVAAGLPCIVSDAVFEGLPAEITPACVRASTAETFARQIVQMLGRSPSQRRATARRANLEPLTWGRRLATLEDVIQRATARRRIA